MKKNVEDDIEFKNKIQYKALSAWVSKDKIGTVELSTGFGKTFVALKALLTMTPNTNEEHIFLAEVTDRYDTLIENIRKFDIINCSNILKRYNIKFCTYQSAYKLRDKKFGLVIADEIHDSLTPKYARFYSNNEFKALIGLTARVNRNIKYTIENTIFTKGDLLDAIAPVCYKYSLNQAIEDNTSRDLKVHIIYNTLDTKNKNVRAGSLKKPFFQTEYKAYEYWNNRHKKAYYIDDDEKREREISITANKRKNILYNSHKKIYIVKFLLRYLKNKSIIFANSLEFLHNITENVISSKNTSDKNKQIINWFDKGIIKFIGSFKKLKQGANLAEDLDNCIIASYYSSDIDLEQRIGRLRNNGTQGNVFIILTKDTQEEIWFNSMMKAIKNMNVIKHESVFDCVDYLKNENKNVIN